MLIDGIYADLQYPMWQYPEEVLRHWHKVKVEANVTVDSVSSWVKIECVLHVDEACASMRDAPTGGREIRCTLNEGRVRGSGRGEGERH